MSKRHITAAAAFAAAAAFVAPAALAATPQPQQTPVLPSDLITSQKTVQLKSNSTQTIVMPVQGLGQDLNVETPCFGFQVSGPGVDIQAAELAPYGKITGPLDGDETPADIGAVQQPDGSWAIPDTVAVLNDERLRMGAACAATGWSWYLPNGQPAIDGSTLQPRYPKAPVSAATARKRAATKKTLAKRMKRVKHVLVGRAAQMGPVSIQVAGMNAVLELRHAA